MISKYNDDKSEADVRRIVNSKPDILANLLCISVPEAEAIIRGQEVIPDGR